MTRATTKQPGGMTEGWVRASFRWSGLVEGVACERGLTAQKQPVILCTGDKGNSSDLGPLREKGQCCYSHGDGRRQAAAKTDGPAAAVEGMRMLFYRRGRAEKASV